MAKPNLRLIDYSDPESSVNLEEHKKSARLPWCSQVMHDMKTCPRSNPSPILAEFIAKEIEMGMFHPPKKGLGDPCKICGHKSIFCKCKK